MKPDPTPYLSWGAFGITGPKPVTGRVKYGAAMSVRSGTGWPKIKTESTHCHPYVLPPRTHLDQQKSQKNLNILTKLIVDLFHHALGQHKN